MQDAAADGRLESLCRDHEVEVLTVFGSAARDERPARDLDVAVRFSRSGADLLGFVVALDDLVGPAQIDVLDLSHAGLVAAAEALVDCLALYESEPGLFHALQLRTVCEVMDTEWLRRLDLERLAT